LLLRPKDGEVPDAQPALEAKKIKALCKQLRPLALPSGAQSDLINLALVGQSPWAPDKPMSGPPRFWKWSVFEEWLTSPKDEVSRLVTEFGIPGPLGEQRTHVAINPDSGAALDTALFQTKGLEFSLQGGAPLALALISAPAKMSPRITGFGGERRLVAWKKVATGEPPACPSEVIEQVGELGACRIVLLTPAAFTTGNLPTRLLEERDSVQPKLIAMALSRYQTVSGWDMAASNGPGKPLGKPKPTRRLVPAGTVLWLNLEGSVQARREWVKNLWFQCISDTDDDRRSGFGVVVAGVWDGKLAELVVPLPESTQHLYGGNAL
jgi:CRISPR-associated protein Cmr3